MELTSSHLKYLLSIYEISAISPDVSLTSIAKRLKVSKPSVATMLQALMKRNLLVKERYGKVYLTDSGYVIAKRLHQNIVLLQKEIPKMDLELDEEDVSEMARLVATEMADRKFLVTL